MKVYKNEKSSTSQFAMLKPQRVISSTNTQTEPVIRPKTEPSANAPKNPDVLLSWKSKQFETVPRSRSWYIGFFVVIALVLAYGLFSDNFLLGIIAVLIALMYYLFEKREVQEFKFGITSDGVFAQDRIYEFSSLESFWIFYEPKGRQELSLKSTKNLLPYIHVPLGDIDPVELRDTMIQFLPEVEHHESAADSLTQMM